MAVSPRSAADEQGGPAPNAHCAARWSQSCDRGDAVGGTTLGGTNDGWRRADPPLPRTAFRLARGFYFDRRNSDGTAPLEPGEGSGGGTAEEVARARATGGGLRPYVICGSTTPRHSHPL